MSIPRHLDREPPRGVDTRARRLGRWSTSLARTSARYALHRVPLFRRNRSGEGPPTPPDLDRELPGDPATVQRARQGYGPLYHRAYRIAFTDARLGAEEVMAVLRRDVNAATPNDLARFEPIDDLVAGEDEASIAVGREHVVHLPGPWNGPVRVVEADETSFTLVTLRGHMEAGQITFRTGTHPVHGWTTFEIESFARSGSRTFHLLYDVLPVGREMQLHMWASFCEAVVRLAGGITMTSVEVVTHRYDDDAARAAGAARDDDRPRAGAA